jgi:sulfoquinovosidase
MLAAALAAAGLLAANAPAAPAATVADAGSLRAVVTKNPWSLTLRGGGRPVLTEFPGLGPGPSGTLGFRSAGIWHHATRVTSSSRSGGAYTAMLATDDQTRTIKVQLKAGREGVIRLRADLMGPKTGVEAVGIAFRAPQGERYLGFGERSNAVDQRGNTVEVYVGEGVYQENERPVISPAFVPPWGFRGRDDATYFPMPWLLSSAGYGVLAGGARTGYFRLGTDRENAWSYEVTAAPPDFPEAVAAPPTKTLLLRFFAGPKPAAVVRRLTRSIGRQPAPEPWFLGSWFQRTGDDELADARALRRDDVPISLYQTYLHYLPCGDQQGNEAEQLQRTADMHALGYAVTTYFNPMICIDYVPAYGEAAAAGALTASAAGPPAVFRYLQFNVSQFDFGGAAGRSFYGRLLSEAVGDGYDGWMEDFGEYTPLDSHSASGARGYDVHNRYPREYHCGAHEATDGGERKLARFVRSGFTSSARCSPIVWSGDPSTEWGFDGLRSAVQNALSIGLSGVGIWGSDVGGYFALFERSLTPEMLTRWVQLGAVSPVMRTQANGVAIPAKERPQVTDEGQIVNYRRWSKFHTQLYPYLRAAAAVYRRSGMPIMRHLVLAYPGDGRAVDREDQFLLGPDLLAAPVLAPGVRQEKVYLPAGRWVDVWRSLRYDSESGGLRVQGARLLKGARGLTVPAPLHELPLMARAGSLLALLPPDVDTLYPAGRARGLVHLGDRARSLELIAFPRGDSKGRFLARGRLRSVPGSDSWQLRISDTRSRRWRLQAALGSLADPFRPCQVKLDGRVLSPRAWSFQRSGSVLRVGFTAPDLQTALTVSACS